MHSSVGAGAQWQALLKQCSLGIQLSITASQQHLSRAAQCLRYTELAYTHSHTLGSTAVAEHFRAAFTADSTMLQNVFRDLFALHFPELQKKKTCELWITHILEINATHDINDGQHPVVFFISASNSYHHTTKQ